MSSPTASDCRTAADSILSFAGGFTFSGEGESMIHHAGQLFANTHIHPPTPPSTTNKDDDEWEDTKMST